MINIEEIKDIINVIKTFKNIDLVVSEYAFNTKYSTQKEIIIESITLFTIVKTLNYEYAKNILEILENKLNDDISNLSEVIKNIKI